MRVAVDAAEPAPALRPQSRVFRREELQFAGVPPRFVPGAHSQGHHRRRGLPLHQQTPRRRGCPGPARGGYHGDVAKEAFGISPIAFLVATTVSASRSTVSSGTEDDRQHLVPLGSGGFCAAKTLQRSGQSEQRT